MEIKVVFKNVANLTFTRRPQWWMTEDEGGALRWLDPNLELTIRPEKKHSDQWVVCNYRLVSFGYEISSRTLISGYSMALLSEQAPALLEGGLRQCALISLSATFVLRFSSLLGESSPLYAEVSSWTEGVEQSDYYVQCASSKNMKGGGPRFAYPAELTSGLINSNRDDIIQIAPLGFKMSFGYYSIDREEFARFAASVYGMISEFGVDYSFPAENFSF